MAPFDFFKLRKVDMMKKILSVVAFFIIAGAAGVLDISSANAADQTCGSYTVSGAGGITYGTVLAKDGKCWLDRNLGATQAATSYKDAASYGYLYQWGRGTDGHQISTSDSDTTTISLTENPGHGNFINGRAYGSGNDAAVHWISVGNYNLWQGVNGINNPCPAGWGLPTGEDWSALVAAEGITNPTTAYNSSLKLPAAGWRYADSAKIYGQGKYGDYWSSSKDSDPYVGPVNLVLGDNNPSLSHGENAASGCSVRCIKNPTSASGTLTIDTVSSLPIGVPGVVYTFSLSASGGTGSSLWSATELPAGLSISPAGIIYGTPTTAGTYTINVTASSGSQIVPKQFKLIIATSASAFCASNPDAWYLARWSDVKGSGFGWIANGGKTHFCEHGQSENRENCFADDACDVPADYSTIAAITTTSLPSGAVGADYYTYVYGSGDIARSYGRFEQKDVNAWSVTGLPDGLSSSNVNFDFVTISGTPTTANTYTVTVTWTDSVDTISFGTYTKTVSKQFSLVIAAAVARSTSLLATDGDSTWLANAYETILGRAPDADGFNGYLASLTSGALTRIQVSAAISGSEEKKQYDFVEALYQSELGRAHDDGGRNYWVNLLVDGTLTQAQVTTSFQNSVEAVRYRACGSSVQGAGSLAYGVVLAKDGKCWLNKNLGATQVATSATDAASYGYLYQWGRSTDGHQATTSAVTASNNDIPNDGNFITESVSPYDWRVTPSDNLWQGTSGTNNPCPTGWRVPTSGEWSALATAENITNPATAFSSLLKLPSAGVRRNTDGVIHGQSSFGYYWSSSPNGIKTNDLGFSSVSVSTTNGSNRADGFPVRCVKDATAATGTGTGLVSTCDGVTDPNAWYWDNNLDVKSDAHYGTTGALENGGLAHFCKHGKGEGRASCFATDACGTATGLATTLTIQTESITSGVVGSAYTASLNSTVVSETGGAYSWSATGLPSGSGLEFAGYTCAMCRSNAHISGMPTTADVGTHTITVTVTAGGKTASKAFTLVIYAANASNVLPLETTTSLPNGTLNVAYPAVTLTSNMEGTFRSWGVGYGDLPYGLEMTENGVIYGTPKESGTFFVTVFVMSGGTSTEKQLVLVIWNATTGTTAMNIVPSCTDKYCEGTNSKVMAAENTASGLKNLVTVCCSGSWWINTKTDSSGDHFESSCNKITTGFNSKGWYACN